MNRFVFMLVAAAAFFSASALAIDPAAREISFSKLWTYSHSATPGQTSEAAAFDRRTNTIWVAGVVGVDVLDAATGGLVEHIDVSGYGAINRDFPLELHGGG